MPVPELLSAVLIEVPTGAHERSAAHDASTNNPPPFCTNVAILTGSAGAGNGIPEEEAEKYSASYWLRSAMASYPAMSTCVTLYALVIQFDVAANASLIQRMSTALLVKRPGVIA